MAHITMRTCSEALQMTTAVDIILPDIVRMDVPMSERKTLYLLHGLSDDSSMWVRRSQIEVFAEKYGLVVVMPSADRSFYLDNINGQNYYTFVSKELPQYLHKVFGTSLKKENNFIAGLSMGGFGAMRIALQNKDRYFAVGSFSGVLALEPLVAGGKMDGFSCGNLSKDELLNSNINPINLINNAPEEKTSDMKIYISCGTSDDLLICTKLFEKRLEEKNVPYISNYSEGGHDWLFWNKEVERFIDFAMNEGAR